MKKIFILVFCSILLFAGCGKGAKVENKEEPVPTINIENDIAPATQIIDRAQEKVDAINEKEAEKQEKIEEIMNENE